MDKNHIHQLRKKKYKTGQSFFYCIGEDCAFKINADLALNKRSLCNICNKPFNLTPYAMRLAKPHCQDCHKVKEQRTDVNIPTDFASQFVFTPANINAAVNTAIQVAESEISLSDRLSSITNPTSNSSVISTGNDARSKVDYREYNPDDDEDN